MDKENAELRYPFVIEDVRQNLSLDPTDDSEDEKILKMSRSEVFERFMTWHGIIGFEHMVKAAIQEIYQVELLEDVS
jgi:hypothetical protein